MEEKKMLNDEELEKVIGGAGINYCQQRNGKVMINPKYFCCQNLSYFKSSQSGIMICSSCDYCEGYHCTNPNVIAQLTNG